MEGLGLISRHFWGWLFLNNTPKLLESKYQGSFWVIFSAQNPQTFMIPIHIVLYHKHKEKFVVLQSIEIV